MANNEDVNQANQGAPAADIPDLKKKEKERKKAGAGWGGAKPGGGSFTGATGGAGARAAASAASSAGGAAAGAAGAAQAAGAGWLSTMIANLTATVLGKAFLAAGVAMFLAGAGVVGYSMLGGGGAGGAGGVGDLGAISSSMKVHTEGGDRTGYIASNGEIMFDPLNKKAEVKKAEPEKAPEDKTAGEAVAPAQIADAAGGGANFNRPGLEHNLSGSKLSSSLGGGFGGKSIFAGSNSAPKFNDALGKTNIKGAQKGRLSAAYKTSSARVSKGGKGQQIKSNRAFGQLKVAKGMSALGSGASVAEGARASAAGAFDGAQTGSGNVEGAPGAPDGAVTSPSDSGGGAPDVTAPNVDDPCVDPNGGPSRCVGADPNTFNALNGIAALAKQAGQMKKTGEMMIMIGTALMIAGAALIIFGMSGTPITAWAIGVGAALLAIGGMLVGMGVMMVQMSEMMKAMADSMSEGLAARTSDVKQDEINKYCIDKAYKEGTDPKNCNPPDSVTENSTITENNNRAINEHKEKEKKDSKTETVDEDLNGKPTGQ